MKQNLVVLSVLVVLICSAINAYAQESKFSDLVKLYKRGTVTNYIPKSVKLEGSVYKTGWYEFDKTLAGGICSFVTIQCPNKIQYTGMKFVRMEKGTLQYEPVPFTVMVEPDLQNISEEKDIEEYAFVVRFCSRMGKN